MNGLPNASAQIRPEIRKPGDKTETGWNTRGDKKPRTKAYAPGANGSPPPKVKLIATFA